MATDQAQVDENAAPAPPVAQDAQDKPGSPSPRPVLQPVRSAEPVMAPTQSATLSTSNTPNEDAGECEQDTRERVFNMFMIGRFKVKRVEKARELLATLRAHRRPAEVLEVLTNSKNGLAQVKALFALVSDEEEMHAHALPALDKLFSPLYAHSSALSPRQVQRVAESILVRTGSFWRSLMAMLMDKKLCDREMYVCALALRRMAMWTSDRERAERFLDAENISGYVDRMRVSGSTSTARIASTVEIGFDDDRHGGRHDNDVGLNDIELLPTVDELLAKPAPYLPRNWASSTSYDDDDDAGENAGEAFTRHYERQFRLLREDMISDLREQVQRSFWAETDEKWRAGARIDGLHVVGTACDYLYRRHERPWSLVLERATGFEALAHIREGKRPNEGFERRREWLEINEDAIIRDERLVALIAGDDVIAVGIAVRDPALLAKARPQVLVRLEGALVLENMDRLARATIKLVQAYDTPMFAYLPILAGLQGATEMPLYREILNGRRGTSDSVALKACAELIKPDVDVGPTIRAGSSQKIVLDESQAEALRSALTSTLSLVQGPPGTGKSFVGALVAKAITSCTTSKILVVCHTNHAVDSFLEEVLRIGVPATSIVRVGFRVTAQLESLKLSEQRRHQAAADAIKVDQLRGDCADCQGAMAHHVKRALSTLRDSFDVLSYLYSHEPAIHDALEEMLDEWTNGKELPEDRRVEWIEKHPTMLWLWSMSKEARQERVLEWRDHVVKHSLGWTYDDGRSYDETIDKLRACHQADDGALIATKRIIAATTSGAAKHRQAIAAAKCDVVIVEEAGEVLESHVLTALQHETKQLVLIGDHQQLRPKNRSYALTVERGDGYDLNRSLFERLVLRGYPHVTLLQQHRMRPELSALVRKLTYPGLKDAPSTLDREHVRGLRDDIVFINHKEPESNGETSDELDLSTSKQNKHEAAVVKRLVRYLLAQGYHAHNLVVLTPYLGQLWAILQELTDEFDPVLSGESNSVTLAGRRVAKKLKHPTSIRVATIDGYQGEEADIVIVSMTRSNAEGAIGFMAFSQRVNVMLSRARVGLIVLANLETFDKGAWVPLKELIKDKHVYDGLPVRCERHERDCSLSSAADFDALGGGRCDYRCDVLLSCGKHKCALGCHAELDHAEIICTWSVSVLCDKGHKMERKCGVDTGCPTCARSEPATQRTRLELMQQERLAALAHAGSSSSPPLASATNTQAASTQVNVWPVRNAASAAQVAALFPALSGGGSPLSNNWGARQRQPNASWFGMPSSTSSAPSTSASTSSAPSGSAPSGSAPSGSAPSGSAPSGSAPLGSAPSGSAPSTSAAPRQANKHGRRRSRKPETAAERNARRREQRKRKRARDAQAKLQATQAGSVAPARKGKGRAHGGDEVAQSAAKRRLVQ